MNNVIKLHRQLNPQDIPSCVDCKWHYRSTHPLSRMTHDPLDHTCGHPFLRASGINPVTGEWRASSEPAEVARMAIGHCGPGGDHFEEKHWSQRYRPTIVLAVIVLIVLFWTAWSKAEEPLPDSWAAQIEITGDPYLVPADNRTEFEAEFGARMQPREGEMEDGGELDPTGKPVDMEINNLKK